MACPKDMRTTRPHTLWVGVCTCPEGTEPAIPRRQLSSLLPTGHLLHKRIKLSRVLIRADPPSKPLDQVVTAPLADFVLCQGLVVLLTEPAHGLIEVALVAPYHQVGEIADQGGRVDHVEKPAHIRGELCDRLSIGVALGRGSCGVLRITKLQRSIGEYRSFARSEITVGCPCGKN
jgi:hypothetical protein